MMFVSLAIATFTQALPPKLPPRGGIEVHRPRPGTSIRPTSPIVVGGQTLQHQDAIYDVTIEVFDNESVMIAGATVFSKPKTGTVGYTFPPPQGGWPPGPLTIIVTNAGTPTEAETQIHVVPKGDPVPPPPELRRKGVKPKNPKVNMGLQDPGNATFRAGETITIAGTVELEGAIAEGHQLVFFDLLDSTDSVVTSGCGGDANQVLGTTYAFSFTWTMPMQPGTYRLTIGSGLTDDDDLGTVTIVP